MSRLAMALCLAIVVAVGLSAQQPTAGRVESVKVPGIETVAPALDELEQAWILIHQLQQAYGQAIQEADACRAALAPYRKQGVERDLTANLKDLKAKIDARHPGFSWDPQTGGFTKVEPPPPPKK